MVKTRSFIAYVFVLMVAFVLSGCITSADRISKAKLEVNPAPEMRGAGENFTSGHKYRFSGGVNAAPSSSQRIHDVYNEWADWCGPRCQNTISEHESSSKVNLEYDFEYSYVNGSAEVLVGLGPLLWSSGVGINSGSYVFTTLGVNTKHFEIGVAGGLWSNLRRYKYEGIEYSSFLGFLDEEVNDVAGSTYKAFANLLGFYASLYFGPVSLELSASMYDVDLENNDLSATPWIFTMYTTVGYRLNEHWQIRAGAVNLQGSRIKNAVWSGFAGVSYWL